MSSKLALCWLLFVALLSSSCSTPQENLTYHKEPLVINQRSIIYGSLIKKPLIRKNGTPAKRKELYLNYNNKSYFIKFCESQIARQTIENLYTSNTKEFTFEVELAEGEWDVCEENYEQQSRIGEYILLHRFIE